MTDEEKAHQRKVRNSNISAVVSISLVLFLIGILGLIMLYAQTLSIYVKENIGFSIIMKDNTKEVDILQMQKFMDASPNVKSTEFISKDEAAKRLKEDLGEDFVEFLGYNPLLPSIDVRLKAAYATPDSLAKMEAQLIQDPKVHEVYYQKSLVEVINRNVRKMGFVILIFCGLLGIVAVALINNTIRLSVYSKRFIIKSMQLVGATQEFIRKPFVVTGIIRGLIGAGIANIMLLFVILFVRNSAPELFALQEFVITAILFTGVVAAGALISWLSTTFAVRKYLKLKGDDLYY
jgi:cell division transport system permease protein